MTKRVFQSAAAAVRFKSLDLDPLAVTKLLQLPPDRQHRDKEPNLSRTVKGKVVRYSDYRGGLWSMSSKAWVDSPRLETHLNWLLLELEPRADAIEGLLSGGIEADLFCYSFGSSKEPPSLPRSIRDRAAGLGLSIGIDHHEDQAEAQVDR